MKWYDNSNSAFENGKASLINVFFLTPPKLLFWPEENGIEWSFHDSMEIFFMSLHQEEYGASQIFLPTVIFNRINTLIDFSNFISSGYIQYCVCGIRVYKSHILAFLNDFIYNCCFLILKHYLQLPVDSVK